MLFQIILIILIGAVAFFHYIQGMFSATISAIVVVIAAVLAVSYHEWLAYYLIARFPDCAAAISLVAIFALVYIIIRLAIDAMVPGNIRLPVIMDKVGAGAMGVFVGLIVTGIISIAAASLPFSPSIAGYTRIKTDDETTGHYMGTRQWQDAPMYYLTHSDSLDPDSPDADKKAEIDALWFHQDDLVIGLTNKLSDGGALSNDKPLAAIHPDYLTELFAQRLGIQVGAKHTLVSPDASPLVKVVGIYTPLWLMTGGKPSPLLPQLDGELPRIRHPEMNQDEAAKESAKVTPLAPGTGRFLILRVEFSGSKDISDEGDRLLRFSPASIRLMAAQSGTPAYRDYYPIATLDAKNIAITHRIDDFLFAETDKTRTIDFVFVVDNEALKAMGKNEVLNDGTFLEVKRNARVDLSNKRAILGPPLNQDNNSILLKTEVITELKTKVAATLVQPDTATDEKK